MKLPDVYFKYYPTGDYPEGVSWEHHSLKGFSEWVTENKPKEIEMTENQFWNFTALQPLPYEERYWTTFHGIPIRCPEMTEEQQINLRLN